jgi:hypothetical protein
VDDNHTEVIKMLEALGCRVQSLASVGRGVPDLLVQCDGVLHLVEVKDGRPPRSPSVPGGPSASWSAARTASPSSRHGAAWGASSRAWTRATGRGHREVPPWRPETA